MMRQGLAPGVENGDHAGLGAEVLWIGADDADLQTAEAVTSPTPGISQSNASTPNRTLVPGMRKAMSSRVAIRSSLSMTARRSPESHVYVHDPRSHQKD
jgi:hypothetical protein